MYLLRVAKPVVFDLLAAIAFAAVFFLARQLLPKGSHSVMIATAAGIAIGIAQFAYKKIRREKIGPLQWLSLVIVTVLGTFTLVTRNPLFIMLKPSIIDFSVGIFMATRHWMEPYLPEQLKGNLSPRLIARWSNAWAALMLSFAVINVVVALSATMEVWLVYATFVPTGIIVIFFLVQYFLLQAMAQRNVRARPATQTT